MCNSLQGAVVAVAGGAVFVSRQVWCRPCASTYLIEAMLSTGHMHYASPVLYPSRVLSLL